MTTSPKWIPCLILAGLSAGMLRGVSDLGTQTQGAHSGLCVAAGLVVMSLGMLVLRRSLTATLYLLAPVILLAALAVSISASISPVASGWAFGGSLCWAVLIACAAIFGGSIWKDPACSSEEKRVGAREINQHDRFVPVTAMADENRLHPQNAVVLTVQGDIPRSPVPRDPPEIKEITFSPPPATNFEQLRLCLPGVELSDTNDEFDVEETEQAERDPAGQAVQVWSRLESAFEARLSGTLIVEMPAGQKQCYVHVPFIPFFTSPPTGECECECDGAEEAEVCAEIDLLQPYGARLCVRRRGDVSRLIRVRVMLMVAAPRKSARVA